MSDVTSNEPSFDSYAANYEDALNQGLKFTGEDRWYYASRRSQLTAQAVAAAGGGKVERILDFGCGTGTATRCLLDAFPAARVIGSDPSGESLEVAVKDHQGLNCEFVLPGQLAENVPSDLAYTNGVFHHILPDERLEAARSVFAALKPGGFFAFWENNPWNPAVWFVMSRVPFDHDAIMLWPRETRGLLRQAGFEVVETRFWFVFPGLLSAFRPVEKVLSPLPLGGQYMVLARKPSK
jgi:SAM-dependent methyltransferase